MQRPLTSRPSGWLAGPGPALQPLAGWFHTDTLQEALEGNPKLKVGGGQIPWPADHVARSAGHHLACCKSSFDPYK
jgi:hypothetical protein